MIGKNQFVTHDKARIVKNQHKKNCADCPWGRGSIKGWLGYNTAEEWITMAHGEAYVECHSLHGEGELSIQCAGFATFRANVFKKSRNPKALVLPRDKERVFANGQEFIDHHVGSNTDER